MMSAMPALRGVFIFATGLVLAACEQAGFTGQTHPHASGAAFVLDEALPPSVVLAARPTVSEILDLILRERPTAAEMVGRSQASVFPEGSDEAHVASVLRKYTPDSTQADLIASVLVKEGRRRKIGSSLVVGVLLTENPWLDPRATSFAGARGLMQVMPFHAGKWGCGSSDLFDIESNICHGVAVLAENLGRSRTLPQALLGYNGCVRGTNTPDCWRYPAKVFREAQKTVGRLDDIRPFSNVATRRARTSSGG